jgi:hypothetical protein
MVHLLYYLSVLNFSHWSCSFSRHVKSSVCVYIYLYLAVLYTTLHFIDLNRILPLSLFFFDKNELVFIIITRCFSALFVREFDNLLLYCFDMAFLSFVLLRAIAYRNLFEYNQLIEEEG